MTGYILRNSGSQNWWNHPPVLVQISNSGIKVGLGLIQKIHLQETQQITNSTTAG